MQRYGTVRVAAVAAVLLLGGCGDATPPGGPPPAAGPEETVSDHEQPTPTAGRGGKVVEDAVRDLARRLDVDRSRIRVVSTEEVTWRDASLGCPRPGMMYPQVLTEGSRVVLEAQGERYEYHAGGRRSAFLCENPEPPAPR